MEVWINLEAQGFSGYAVSSWGRVKNDRSGRDIIQSRNNRGSMKVSLNHDAGHRVTILVSRLVAQEFVPGRNDIFDTPIHKDGNKDHNFSENLAWRPRWHAVKFMRQFETRQNWLIVPIWDIHSGEEFRNSEEAIVKYGILGTDIAISTINHTRVFPTGQEFRIIE